MAHASDVPAIRGIYRRTPNPRRARLRAADYYVAQLGSWVVGCGAVRRLSPGGYLYGLAVLPNWRRRGIGSALVARRVEWLTSQGATFALLLTMFWNVRFFRRQGFRVVPKQSAPTPLFGLDDFRSPSNRRSAVMLLDL